MRPKAFINSAYFLSDNPFPAEPIVSWGGNDPRSNGSLYEERVLQELYEEAVLKFIVNPVDTRSKFHFLWSLGRGQEARGFGKTATLHYLARKVNHDLGSELLRTHGFDEREASETPILCSMATFDTQKVTTLAAVSLEHVRYLIQEDETKTRPLGTVLDRLKKDLLAITQDEESDEQVSQIRHRIEETELGIRGKTIATIDQKFVGHFAKGQFRDLQLYLNTATPRLGFQLLHTIFVIAIAAKIRRVYLLIDQVEDFANPDVPKKRRHMEVERFRDLAIESQPFGEMASYVLTMHPDAAYTIEEYWSLARLPRIDHASKQNERVTVILKPLETSDQADKLLRIYMNKYRNGSAPDPLFPFTKEAVERIRYLAEGRPGDILQRANKLIDYGAVNQKSKIDEKIVLDFFSEEIPQTIAAKPRRAFGSLE